MKTSTFLVSLVVSCSVLLGSACVSSASSSRAPAPISCDGPRPFEIGGTHVALAASFCGVGFDQFYWDGARCAAVADDPCRCGVTIDCGPYYADAASCEVAHAACR